MSKFFDKLKENKKNGMFISGDYENGEYKRWYYNGQLWYKYYYLNNKLNGESKEWHPNGQLFIQCFFKNGKFNGEFKRWNNFGKLDKYYLYENGEIIKDLFKKDQSNII